MIIIIYQMVNAQQFLQKRIVFEEMEIIVLSVNQDFY